MLNSRFKGVGAKLPVKFKAQRKKLGIGALKKDNLSPEAKDKVSEL